jgi:dTDP-glucose 4,6-dehydratase
MEACFTTISVLMRVYGSLGAGGLFTQKLQPTILIHPIRLKRVLIILFHYMETYGLPYVVTNCSNNYGLFIS